MKLKKRQINFFIKIVFTVGAYLYIFYRLNNTFHTSEDFNIKTIFNRNSIRLIGFSVLLMPVNWLIEAIKWKKLLLKIEHISLSTSIKSVLAGLTSSIFTPYRLGEYYGRPLFVSEKNRSSSIVVNLLGSICQNIITYGAGFIGFYLFYKNNIQLFNQNTSYISILLTFVIFITFILFFIKPLWLYKIISKLIKISNKKFNPAFLKKYKISKLLSIITLSLIRYFVFLTQYILLLKAFNIEISIINAFIAISLNYIFLFTIPGIPIADIGIRGSVALFFLGMYSNNNTSILLASSSLWVVNLAIPAIVGSFFLLKK